MHTVGRKSKRIILTLTFKVPMQLCCIGIRKTSKDITGRVTVITTKHQGHKSKTTTTLRVYTKTINKLVKAVSFVVLVVYKGYRCFW